MNSEPTSPTRLVLGAGVCLLAGLGLGRAWPGAGAPVWNGPSKPIAAPHVGTGPASFADVVARTSPAVVTLRTELPAPLPDGIARDPRENGGVGGRSGSGFVVNGRGLVVTSRHVVAGATSIEVLVPGKGGFVGELVGEDPATDLAMVRLVAPPAGLQALELGCSEDLRAGDWIVAVGNPYGFDQTVTAGVVSYVDRRLRHSDFAVTNDFLQFSAPVNPGSSGCPVLDLEGRVVGVTTQAAVAAQGISFAVPSRTVKSSLDAMAKSRDGRVRRGHLGIEFISRGDLAGGDRHLGGAVILRVAEGGAGARAGLRPGDVVVKVGDDDVVDATVLHDRIVGGDPGSKLALELLRDGRVQDPIVAVLGELGGQKSTDPAN